MSEIKFTEEELESIRALQQKSNDIVVRFGQLSLTKINLEKQSEAVEEEEFKLHKELEALKIEETKSIETINKKYGPGSLNPQTGVFTPTTEIQSEEK